MSENIKWKYEPYAYYNKTAIEEHLTQMAKEGWMIESMGCFWKYQKIKPVNRAFEVVYFPELDQTKGDLIPEQKEYKEQLDSLLAQRKEDGWTLALVHNKMLVFYRDGTKGTMTEKASLDDLATIKKAANEGRISGILCFALLAISNGLSMSTTPFYMIMSMEVILLIIFVGVLLWHICSLVSFSIWYKNAKKQIEIGGSIPVKKEHFFSKNSMEYVPMLFVCVLFFLHSDELFGKAASIGLAVVFIPLLQWSEWATDRTSYKRLMGIKGRNIGAWSTASSIVALTICICGIVASDAEMFETEKHVPPMLKAEDVYEYEDDDDYYYEDHETFFARTERWEFAPGDCYYVKIKKPAFYDFILKLFCIDEYFELENSEELDPIPWGAEHVYYDGEKYLVLWDDVIMSLNFFDGPTPEQIAVIKAQMSK